MKQCPFARAAVVALAEKYADDQRWNMQYAMEVAMKDVGLCVEEQCGLWDEAYEGCGLVSAPAALHSFVGVHEEELKRQR